jgi:hypothetical protein
MKGPMRLAIVLLLACSCFAAPIAWVAPSLVRVGQTGAAGTTNSIALCAARGETQSFQVIIQAPAGGLTNVNVAVSDLTGLGGATMPSSYQIKLS